MAIGIISCVISVLGFLLTYAGLARKMVLKEDLKAMLDQLTDLSDRTVELEKKVALLEYRVTQLESKEC